MPSVRTRTKRPHGALLQLYIEYGFNMCSIGYIFSIKIQFLVKETRPPRTFFEEVLLGIGYLIFLAAYGGYFLVTYLMSTGMVQA